MKLFGYLATFIFSVGAAVVLSILSMNALAENGEEKRVVDIDQSSVCVASSDEQALGCPAGEMFMARLALSDADVNNPLIRENRLLNTMALYCDTNYQIHKTQVGILCVLTHERISAAASDESAEAIE